MTMTEYEITIIVRPDIGGDAVESTLDRVRDVIRNRGGKLFAINHWGKRKLAFEIEKHARGIFVHIQFLGGNTLVQELERNLRINDSVLRFMTIRVATQVEADAREEKAYERPQYDLDDGADEAEADEEQEHGDRDRDRDRDDRGRDRDRDDRGRDSRDGPSGRRDGQQLEGARPEAQTTGEEG